MHSPEQIEAKLVDLGLDIISCDKSVIKFWFNGNTIQYFFKKQWATGKGIEDGRGFTRLLNQLK